MAESQSTPSAIAVIGSGYWGKNLVRNFHQLKSLKVICDINEKTLADFKKQYPDVEVSLSLSEILVRSDVDGIVIATPAETHFTLAREALTAGKHVYIEKPLVLDESEGRVLIDLAAEKRLTLMVGHLLQYHSAFIKLKEMANAGELGRISYIYSHRLNFGKIRREENILWSFAPHDISMILSLVGENPHTVHAIGTNFLHQKIADVTTTHLEFPSGIKAHIFVSWLHPYKEQNLVVVGDRKMAVFNDVLPWDKKLCVYPHKIKWENNIPVPAKAEPEYVKIEESEPLKAECAHFLHCIASGQHPITDGVEGLNVLRILNASQRSLDEQSKRITIGGSGSDSSNVEVGRERNFFVHPTAILDNDVEIGDGTKIWHFSHVLSKSTVGKNCNIGQNVTIGPHGLVGDGCKIQNNVSVYKGVVLEDGVFCGPSMVFTNVINPRAEIRKMDQARTTLVKKGATLGANSTILCGITLGRYSFIGAGAVVTKDVPDHALMIGNPARQKGWMCRCGEKLQADLVCLICGKRYRKSANGIQEND